jgi:negative regulator of genetic competence, sporulation and motility
MNQTGSPDNFYCRVNTRFTEILQVVSEMRHVNRHNLMSSLYAENAYKVTMSFENKKSSSVHSVVKGNIKTCNFPELFQVYNVASQCVVLNSS